jgi:hypothetical protein
MLIGFIGHTYNSRLQFTDNYQTHTSDLSHVAWQRLPTADILPLHSYLFGCPRDRYSVIASTAVVETEPLLSNGCCVATYFAVVSQQRVNMPQYLCK